MTLKTKTMKTFKIYFYNEKTKGNNVAFVNVSNKKDAESYGKETFGINFQSTIEYIPFSKR